MRAFLYSPKQRGSLTESEWEHYKDRILSKIIEFSNLQKSFILGINRGKVHFATVSGVKHGESIVYCE